MKRWPKKSPPEGNDIFWNVLRELGRTGFLFLVCARPSRLVFVRLPHTGGAGMRKIWDRSEYVDVDAALGMECRILVFDAGPVLQWNRRKVAV